MRFLRKTHYFRIALYSSFQFEFLCEEVFRETFDYNALHYFRVKTVEIEMTGIFSEVDPARPSSLNLCFNFKTFNS